MFSEDLLLEEEMSRCKVRERKKKTFVQMGNTGRCEKEIYISNIIDMKIHLRKIDLLNAVEYFGSIGLT